MKRKIPTLKLKPIIINENPQIVRSEYFFKKLALIWVKFVEPKEPYNNAIPYIKNPVANAPNKNI